jgi:glycolate oxidase iron-sulfur subunit
VQINLAKGFQQTAEGQEAEAILRSCVHCGFCLATCPTYQLLGDELDSPRGRIYLMKQMFEGNPVTEKTRLHLDRCLTCRACETTCPSGVKYGRLVDIGRGVVERRLRRGPIEAVKRKALRAVLPRASVFSPLLKLGQLARPALPASLKRKIPGKQKQTPWPAARHPRRMVVLNGCVQPALSPNINAAAARVLDKLGISLVRDSNIGCCGAVAYHLNAHEEAMETMRHNIHYWVRQLNRGTEAIVMTASGCGTMVKEYGVVLNDLLHYAGMAERVSEHTKDLSEIVGRERDALAKLLEQAGPPPTRTKVAYHPPCSLQHAQKLNNVIEPLLASAGFELTAVPDAHLCCGSAGTYSILQPELAQRLLKNKVEAVESGAPDVIATANIGCMTHIQSGTAVPVRHWIELIDERLARVLPAETIEI